MGRKYLDQHTRFAARLVSFGSIRKVPHTEAARWPAYQRRPIRTAARRDWTHEEIERLTTLLDAGYDYVAIAPRLRRTPTAIQVKAKRLRCVMSKRPTVLVASEVGTLLGLRCSKKVADWIARGWLPAKTRGHGRIIWAVQWDDLMTFLRNRMYWMAWQPERITDSDLRTEMMALRAGQPCWLTPGEVARRYGVGIAAVGQWISKGWLQTQRYGNHWFWEGDLDGWTPPCERSRAGIPRGAGRRVVGAAAIVAVARDA